MPAPSSVTVTVSGPVSAGPVTPTRTRVAPARRAFCRVSENTSPMLAAKVLVTRRMALSWMRARMVGVGVSFMYGLRWQ